MRKKPENLNCIEVENLAQKYIDGYLSEDEKQLFEQHLNYCLPCDKKIEFEKKLREIVRLKAKNESFDIQSNEKFKRLISSLE